MHARDLIAEICQPVSLYRRGMVCWRISRDGIRLRACGWCFGSKKSSGMNYRKTTSRSCNRSKVQTIWVSTSE